MNRIAFPIACAALALSACNAEAPPSDEAPADAASPSARVTQDVPGSDNTGVPDGEPVDSGTIGGDGSELRLDPLDLSAEAPFDMAGELGCTFTRTGQDTPILIAKGFVDVDQSASGMISTAGYPTRIVATEPGGFDAIVDGGRFAAKGMTIDVRRGKAPVPGTPPNIESPPYPAAMRAMRADGAERSFNGVWQCGP